MCCGDRIGRARAGTDCFMGLYVLRMIHRWTAMFALNAHLTRQTRLWCGNVFCHGLERPGATRKMSTQRDRCAELLGWIVSCCCWLLLASPTVAQQWEVHETLGNVELFSEFRLLPNVVAAQLASVEEELSRNLNLVQPDNAGMQVIVFKSAASYRAYLSSRIPEARHRRAIFYRSGDQYQIYAYRHEQLLTDLRHEYTHAILHRALPFVPLWIDEGLAEYLEVQPERRARSSRLMAMKWKCRTGWKPSLRNLESIPSAARMTGDHYRDSWAWTHYLLNESDQTRTLFREYLAAVSAGAAPGAFSEWVALRDSEVEKRVGSYFRRFRISLR